MSTPEEIRERRRLKVLEKLNAKYKDTPAEEEQQIITNPAKTDILPPKNIESETKTTPNAPKEQSKASVFDEYKKMRNFQKFEELFFKVRTLILILYSFFSAFIMVGNPLFVVPIHPLIGFLILQLTFSGINQFTKKSRGTSYFDQKALDIPGMNKLMGNNMAGVVDVATSYVKVFTFLLEKVEDLSLYIVFTFMFCELLNFLNIQANSK